MTTRSKFLHPYTRASALRGKNKVKKLETKLSQMEREAVQLKDQLLRKMAEFDNYRKRTDKVFSNLVMNANASLIKELLPVIDDLGRSLDSNNSTEEIDQFKKGIQMIYDKCVKIFENQGVRSFESVGKPFNIEKHEAIMQIESPDHPSNVVIEEYEKGYTMNDKVIRHSKVVVTK